MTAIHEFPLAVLTTLLLIALLGVVGCSGASDEQVCPLCKGSGAVGERFNAPFNDVRMGTTCPLCEGKGTVPQRVADSFQNLGRE
jgi:DnaJ-class molecular chaperone